MDYYQTLDECVESDDAIEDPVPNRAMQFDIHIPLEDSVPARIVEAIGSCSVRVELPQDYPFALPGCRFLCPEEFSHISAQVNGSIRNFLGEEAITLTTALSEVSETSASSNHVTGSQSSSSAVPEDVPTQPFRQPARQTMMRVLIWSHHIMNIEKRKSILNWAAELGLYGFSKIGFPGYIYVEGRQKDCEEYVSRLKSLRWQALSVREEEKEEVIITGYSSLRRNPQDGNQKGTSELADAIDDKQGGSSSKNSAEVSSKFHSAERLNTRNEPTQLASIQEWFKVPRYWHRGNETEPSEITLSSSKSSSSPPFDSSVFLSPRVEEVESMSDFSARMKAIGMGEMLWNAQHKTKR
ncbi:RWD domain-containing protein 2B [Quaeritorhiza haematococci]|nr:RWD domain-containing protein 2B [Quaeritorhiza haematococci]